MGYKTVLQEIGKRAVFDIMMEENSKVMKEVVVEARPKIATGGLEIPEREQSFAQQTIKMTEFEGLSFTSADEALQDVLPGWTLSLHPETWVPVRRCVYAVCQPLWEMQNR